MHELQHESLKRSAPLFHYLREALWALETQRWILVKQLGRKLEILPHLDSRISQALRMKQSVGNCRLIYINCALKNIAADTKTHVTWNGRHYFKFMPLTLDWQSPSDMHFKKEEQLILS